MLVDREDCRRQRTAFLPAQAVGRGARLRPGALVRTDYRPFDEAMVEANLVFPLWEA